jgi:hypothetical protein
MRNYLASQDAITLVACESPFVQPLAQTKRRVIPGLIPPRTSIPNDDDAAFLKTRHAIKFPSTDDEAAVADLAKGVTA